MYNCKYPLGQIIKMIDNDKFRSLSEICVELSDQSVIEWFTFLFDKKNLFDSRKCALETLLSAKYGYLFWWKKTVYIVTLCDF